MEEEKQTKTGSYVTGIIGAIIGGAIAALPWILTYIYGNMLLSILAALIAAGEFYGYKLAKGKITKKLPIILMVLAILIVSIITLVIIPGLLIQKEGMVVSPENIIKSYSIEGFTTAIMRDYIISLVFTILGASIITANLKKQLNNEDGKDVKLDLSNNEELTKIKNAAIELIKPVFTKYEATTKEKAMMKEEVLAEIENQSAKPSFNYLKQLGIIKKYKGKYYYSEENEEKQTKTKKISNWGIAGIIIIVLAVFVVIASMLDGNSVTSIYEDDYVSFEVGTLWNQDASNYETEWNFYRYINSFPDENADEEDYSSYPALINVYYNEMEEDQVTTLEDIQGTLETTINSAEEKPDVFETNISTTGKGYQMLKVKMTYTQDPEQVLYYYYIMNGKSLCCVTAYSFTLEDDETLEKEADNIVNTFAWKTE